MAFAFTIVSYAAAAVVSYYLALFLISLWTTRRTPDGEGPGPVFVVVVPARDEELVIEQTVRRLRELRGERLVALIANDGSTDRTSEAATAAADGDPRVVVLDRPEEIAGQGKGAVLNHAYRLVSEMVEAGDPRLHGATPDDVVLGIVDADGWLDHHALEAVAPYYHDRRVAGVQLPVRIWNRDAGFLTLMQDLEFTAFSLLVQAGRDPFGSVGLGGNGQFVRLSALQSLGAEPWTRCLTEDLDVGLSLVEHGWRNRFCPHAWVAQQGLTSFRPFFRQRTRWIQGHYSCWRHLPALWRSRSAPLLTRLDLSLYLLLVGFVLVFGLQASVAAAGILGWYAIEAAPFGFVDDDRLYRALTLVLSFGPLLAFAATYQRLSPRPLPAWSLPGVLALFGAYGYLWAVPASLRALARLGLRRDAWVKTPRVPIDARTLAVEARA